MINDPIADFLTRLKNAALAGLKTVVVPHSKIKENLAKILKNEGFLKKAEVSGKGLEKKLILDLTKEKNKVALIEVKRISKLGRRVYVKAKDIAKLQKGLGIIILSTPLGLLTGKEARKKNQGGEVICKIV